MSRKRKRVFSCIILIVTIFVLVVVDLGRTFAYFVINGEIVTSSFNGPQSFNGDYTVNNIPFSNDAPDSIAVVIDGGNFKINNSVIEKNGDSSSALSDGSNSAVVVHNGASLELFRGSVTTNGTYSHGVFSDAGIIKVTGTNIKTNSSYSNGIVVSNGGSITTNYITLETMGDYSSAIRVNSSDSFVTVYGGTFKTNGANSPVLNSLGDVVINNASLNSLKSEGIVINGNHSVTLNSTSLSTNNVAVSDGFITNKSISMYQSGDKTDDSVARFTSSNGTMTTNCGDTFYITNTKAVVKLVNNTIVNNDGNFMRIGSSNFGTVGNNGGDVVLSLSNQSVFGNIIVDNISKLEMNLSDGSVYDGVINQENSALYVSLNLSLDSKLVLRGNTYVNSLEGVDNNYSNIDFNGYDLFVNGEKLVVPSHSGSQVDSNSNEFSQPDTNNNTSSDNNSSNDNNTSNDKVIDNNKNTDNSSIGTSQNNSSNTSDNNSVSSHENQKSKSNGSSNNEPVEQVNPSNTNDNYNQQGTDYQESYSNEIDMNEEDLINSGDHHLNESLSIYSLDDRTLLIINIIGVVLIITSVLSIIKNRALKDIDNV